MERIVNEEIFYHVLYDSVLQNDEFNKTGEFENDTFKIHWYRWDDDIPYANELEEDPCFYHKPSGFKLTWYKYPLRGVEVNKELTNEQFLAVLYDCYDSFVSTDKLKVSHKDWVGKEHRFWEK